jgi:hypothetical protein
MPPKKKSDRPYFVLFTRKAGARCYENAAGGTERHELVADATRFMMRGGAGAIVGEVVYANDPIREFRRPRSRR